MNVQTIKKRAVEGDLHSQRQWLFANVDKLTKNENTLEYSTRSVFASIALINKFNLSIDVFSTQCLEVIARGLDLTTYTSFEAWIGYQTKLLTSLTWSEFLETSEAVRKHLHLRSLPIVKRGITARKKGIKVSTSLN